MKETAQKIFNFITQQQKVSMKEMVDKFSFSRAYLNRILNLLIQEKKIVRVGQTNKVRYLLFNDKILKEYGFYYKREFKNIGLNESFVFGEAVKHSQIFSGLDVNVFNILQYTFLEMLNNAIDHSQSKKINIEFTKKLGLIRFMVIDKGIGIFNNIIQKKGLNNELEAIQDLFKGKQTTAPEKHSGEGIFFTSKIADVFFIISGRKEVIVDNCIQDIIVNSGSKTKGTQVIFEINIDSNKNLKEIFDKFSTNYEFDTTQVKVKLYKIGVDFISRSEARRLLVGLDKFKKIIIDFDKVQSIGQAFADEIFRVYQNFNPDKEIRYINATEDVEFMIKRALAA